MAFFALLVLIVMFKKTFFKMIDSVFGIELEDDDDDFDKISKFQSKMLKYISQDTWPVIVAYIIKPFVMSVIKSQNCRNMTN